jgi:hypothetical protein
MGGWSDGGVSPAQTLSRLGPLLGVLAACADGASASLPLPPLGTARALIVAATGGDALPEAVALDVEATTPTLPTLRDADLADGVFTVLLYDRPLAELELSTGPLSVRAAGVDVDPIPTPARSFERAATRDDAWLPKATLEQTALRPGLVGLPRPCRTIEATWTPIEGGSGYAQAWTWLDPETLLAATNPAELYRVDVPRARVTRLTPPGPLITALHTTRDGRVFAGTASTALVMRLELDGDAARLTPLGGARVPPEDAIGALAGPPPEAADAPEFMYGLSRFGLLLRVPLAAPTIEPPEPVTLGEGSAGAGLVWLSPDRYVGYSNRALGRLVELERGNARLRALSLGAFSTIARHPSLGAVLQPWLIAAETGEARPLPKLPAPLVDVEAAAPVADGVLFSGQGGLVALYLVDRDQVCSERAIARTKLSQLIPLPSGDVLAFADAEPARDIPLSLGIVRVR